MLGRLGKFLVAFGFVLLLAPAMALADARVALIIGNGEYGPEIGKLKNPTNDAALMADTLKGLGFDVALVENADQKEMKRAIREFGQKLRGTGSNGIGLFYYAGHGVQIDGENYLLPIGAQIEAEGDVELEAVSASSVLSQMQYAGNAVNLVFLDACRNNPLTRNFRSGTRGLARVDAPRGSFVGYSTAPGDVSVDGDANNSPYTLALVEELKTPGTSIEEAHRAVRAKVLAATNQRQTPWDSSSLTGPVVLAKAEEAPVAAPAEPAPQQQVMMMPAPATGNNQQAELLFWESIKDSNNPAVFEAYLKQFPNGVFTPLAQAKLDELKPAQQAQVRAAEPAETQQAAITPAPEPAPAAEESAPVEIEDMAGVYVAKKSANVRAAPTTDAKVLTKLAADQAADVTGQVAGGEWLRVNAAGKEGFVSASLMAESSAEEVAAWKALKAKPSEKGAKAFLAAHPDGYFEPKANALLAKLQAPEQPVAAAEPVAPAVVATAPAATQQAAVTPAPAKNMVRISSALREKVERYLKNSESFGQYYRFLAVSQDGSRIGVSNCTKVLTWASSGCGGVNDPYEGAKRVALRDCGSGCKLIYEGPKKLGDFEIEWY
ncbi:MAG TPA: caspase family protein [Dongiaceae bacterium]|nr:caspase family protein [Dongiaceae bacterium]